MSVIKANGAGEVSTGFYNGAIQSSARFDRGSSTYLSQNKSSDGNKRTMTFSWWMKVCNLDSTGDPRGVIYTSGYSGSGGSQSGADIVFSNQRIQVIEAQNNAGLWNIYFSHHFSDPSSWYHCVVVIDTTESTNSDRVKLFVNGVQQTDTDSASWPSSSLQTRFNNNLERIGTGDSGGSPYNHTNIYLADFNLIDGTALTPSSFGEFNNGTWIPIDTAGLTFGSKGWRLQFKETGDGQSTASSSTIGADTSGNNLHFNDNNMDAHDSNMADCPELNFCTINSIFKDVTENTLSEGDLKIVTSTAGRSFNPGTFLMTSGKWYWEFKVDANSGGMGVAKVNGSGGACQSVTSTSTSAGTTDYYYGETNFIYYQHNIRHNGSVVTSLSGSAPSDLIYGVAVDMDASPPTITYYVDGSSVGSADLDTGFDYIPIAGDGSGGVSRIIHVNFGQNPTFNGEETAGTNTDGNGNGLFHDSVPSNHLALCASNLPDLTISPAQSTQADDHFNTVLYTSDNIGAGGTQNVTGVGFQPDWVWLKNRDSGSTSHTLYDSNRGTGRHISSDSSSAEVGLNSIYGYLSAFGVDGYTLTGGTSNANYVNQGTDKYVSWNWKANGGTTSSNTDGSITSTVQANTTAGFSIATYTGTGANGTIGHGLGIIPQMAWVKRRDSGDNWVVYYNVNGLGAGVRYLLLNTNGASVYDTTYWNSSTATSTVINLGTAGSVNTSSGTYVCYTFASIEGYSRIGTYTGNGSTDGSYVYTGFRPAWIILKATSASNWFVFDNKRNAFNVATTPLFASGNSAEEGTLYPIDFLSNGFKLRASSGLGTNESLTYLYMAFAKQPFKFSNSR